MNFPLVLIQSHPSSEVLFAYDATESSWIQMRHKVIRDISLQSSFKAAEIAFKLVVALLVFTNNYFCPEGFWAPAALELSFVRPHFVHFQMEPHRQLLELHFVDRAFDLLQMALLVLRVIARSGEFFAAKSTSHFFFSLAHRWILRDSIRWNFNSFEESKSCRQLRHLYFPFER
jgi:hypothetical protein